MCETASVMAVCRGAFMFRRTKPVRFLLGLFFLLIVSLVHATAQNTTLVYSPDIQLGAAGPIRYLEERTDGQLTRFAELEAPGVYKEFVQKTHSDGSLHRLVWFYDDGKNYIIEEQDSQFDGSWIVSAILTYQNGALTSGQFFSGDNLIEERLYEYDARGRVVREQTVKVSADPLVLEFERPDETTVEAFHIQLDGTRALVARLGYDSAGRLVLEERYKKNQLDKRDVYSYNAAGKLIDHIQYDYRDLPVRQVSYGYTKDGLPTSVVHRDVKDRVLFGVSYTRERYGENTRTTIKNSKGEVTGTIDYIRRNGKDVERTEIFLLGNTKLEITYSEFDDYGNWLRKVLVTYESGSVKEREIASRTIRYFD